MKIPRIVFDESNVGLSPIREGIRNRIGIVGEFSRGPANTASFILGFTDFANRYGSDSKKGSLAFQAAFDQGAEDFSIVRVLGRAQPAKGSVTFAGAATKQNILFFHLKFIGEAIDQTAVGIDAIINTSGKYTATVSGRYFFKVTAIASGTATVKWVFMPLGTEDSLDWSTVVTSISVVLASDQGSAKLIQSGVSLIFGTPGQVTPISLRLNDVWSVRVNSSNFSLNINEGDLPNQIANNLVEKITGVLPVGEAVINSQQDGVIFSLDPAITGTIGNRYSYYFELQDTATPGVTVTPNLAASSAFMQGGVEGPRSASRDFYTLGGTPLLRLQAISQGAWGNQLRVSLYPINNKQFRLSVEDLNAANFNPVLEGETYILDLANTDEAGFLKDLNNSKYIRGLFLPRALNPSSYDVGLTKQSPQRLAPADTTVTDATNIKHPLYYGPSKLISVSLEEGYDGPEITDEDYVQGLTQLESAPVHIVICPGVFNSLAVKASMIAHAEKSTEQEGLRIAILNARPNLNPNSCSQETIGLDSKRAVMVAGWSTYSGQPSSSRFSLSPDGVYAGKLARVPFYAGVNARRTAGAVIGITEVDTRPYSTATGLQLYTDARLEILALDSSAQAFVFTNGRTLSSDTTWDKVSIRRTYDLIRMDLFDLLQQYKAEPHTNLLRTQITSAINAYMNEKLREGTIANSQSAIADSTNNTPENYINGELNISIAFLPIYAADYINITLIRNSQSGLVSFGS